MDIRQIALRAVEPNLKVLNGEPNGDLGRGWQDVAVASVLLREAQTTLGPA